MYHSHLLINVGDNPDRADWRNRNWLRNLYRVHQRLCMAFPTAPQREKDPDFLMPYQPWGFHDPRPERCTIGSGPAAPPRPCAVGAVERPVHVPRDTEHNFLFRVEPQPAGRVVIIVQSAVKPDWDYAFHNAGHFLAAPPQVKSFEPCFAKGQRLRFRLVANPTRKIDTKSGPDGRRRHGKRVPVKADQLGEWLARWGEAAGFSVENDSLIIQPGYVYMNNKTSTNDTARRGDEARLRSVRFDGFLRITDPVRFQEILVRGIGPGKGFGLGLLSVEPAQIPAGAP